MPKISEFYGIIILMYYDESHGKPHIHAKYGGERAVFAIETGELLVGKIPHNKERMVRKWIKIHKSELMVDWKMASSNETLLKIEPLR